MNEISDKDVEENYEKLKKEIEERGYSLNPDAEFTKELVKSLLFNEERYGYWACPCRLASSVKKKDLDIICPCDYRDADLDDYGTCFCGLYVSQDVVDGNEIIGSIPERRNKKIGGKKMEGKKLLVWRCKVCGYLCAREQAPEKCPICGAERERFEEFEI